MAIGDVLRDLRGDHNFMANVVTWRRLESQSAKMEPLPELLSPVLGSLLRRRGLEFLYSHQAQAVSEVLTGHHVAVVTPTASGKTLCYNLPVLHALLTDTDARALYLFPTKALAQDQLAELRSWLHTAVESNVGLDPSLAATYDGDTPSGLRGQVRRRARLILTNPDMLHAGILPYHTQWVQFLAGLRYVVIDEMHTYRGVFGSHVANVLRRLRRICRLYGSQPRFICTSATIANPGQLAEDLLEQPVSLITEHGAPRGEKHVILYNPPIYDAELGLRRSSTLETQELAARTVLGDLQTIVFGRSRLTTELLLSYLRDRLGQAWRRDAQLAGTLRQAIRGYRGGYLPGERRSIEAGLRNGSVRAVVATNALELGIDIGQLQAAILCGYPGSIASTWQQVGRAGRTRETSLAILVATGGVLDQYVIHNPEFLFERSPERALINPDNLVLLADQIRCALFEAPFSIGERLGNSPFTADVLQVLAEDGEAQTGAGQFFWGDAGYPARQVSLRSAGGDNVVIQAHGTSKTTVIGEIDRPSAPLLLHQGAVYLHEGRSYLVQRLDLTDHVADVVPVEVDYYTEVSSETAIDVLATHEETVTSGNVVGHGDLLVTTQVIGFRRIKRFTHETVGVQPLDYPPQLLETTGYWLRVGEESQLALAQKGLWFDGVNDYGPNWQEQRKRVRARDGARCTQCGMPEAPGRQHDVHHLVPFRTFGYVAGVNQHYLAANRLENLALVCRSCHRRLESTVRVRGALDGLAYALTNLAPLHLMCDRQDVGVAVVRDAEGKTPGDDRQDRGKTLPTIYLYERTVAGLGFSLRLYELHETLLAAAEGLIRGCACPRGCPACVGPVLDNEQAQLETKALTLSLLEVLSPDTPITPPDMTHAL